MQFITTSLGIIETVEVPTASASVIKYQQHINLGLVYKARTITETIVAYFQWRGEE